MSESERIALLETTLMKNKKIVLYIVEDVRCHQFRYRCDNVMESMQNSKEWCVVWFTKKELNDIDDCLNKIDLVVIMRQTDKDGAIIRLIQKMHENDIKTLFDLDDLVFDYRDLGVLMSTVKEKNFVYWLGYLWGVRRIAMKVDGFITTNDFLGKKLKRSFNKPYVVIRNSLNHEQVEIAEKILKKKENEEKDDGAREFKIGYFSGSPTHEKDMKVAEDGLLAFLGQHQDAVLEVVGYMKLHGEMKKMYEEGRVRLLPLVDFRKLEGMMEGVDVNIAPLVMNDFTNCKSELKFFEAGVVKTTTIASPTYTFRHAIADGVNGFLAEPGEWYDKLEYLYKHPEENQKIAKKAREYALKHYYGEEFLKEVEKAYDYFAK